MRNKNYSPMMRLFVERILAESSNLGVMGQWLGLKGKYLELAFKSSIFLANLFGLTDSDWFIGAGV